MKCNRTGWLLVGCWLFAVPVWAQDANQTVKTQIRALLATHDQALKQQDLTAVLNTFAPDSVLMGTGPGEYWAGKEAIKDAYEHFFSDYDAGSLDTNCTWRTAGTNGSLAWLMAMCQFTDYLKNEKRVFAVNISAVAEKKSGGWQFQTFHISNITGGAEPPEQSGLQGSEAQ